MKAAKAHGMDLSSLFSGSFTVFLALGDSRPCRPKATGGKRHQTDQALTRISHSPSRKRDLGKVRTVNLMRLLEAAEFERMRLFWRR